MVANGCGRSMVYVEGEATMQKFTTKEGNPNTALSIVQRECLRQYNLSQQI